MSSTQVKNQVRDCEEGGFDTLHRIADGTARGLSNWLLDQHPEDRSRGHNHNDGSWPQNSQPQPQCYPAQPCYYHPPTPPQQGYPGYPSHHPSGNVIPGAENIQCLYKRGRNFNVSMEDGNFGGS